MDPLITTSITTCGVRLPKTRQRNHLGEPVAHLGGSHAAVVILHLARRVAADRPDHKIVDLRGATALDA